MCPFLFLKRFSAVLLLACAAQVPVAHASLLSLQPGTAFASNGDSVSLDLVVSGLGSFGPDSLGAFDISVEYDMAVLSFTGYSLNSFLGDLGLVEAIDISGGAGGGAVNVAEVSLLSPAGLDALQPGEFILASLSFNVLDLAFGATTELSILPGALLANASGVSLPVTGVASATVTTPVPLAGTLWLVLGGFFSASMVRRMKKHSH